MGKKHRQLAGYISMLAIGVIFGAGIDTGLAGEARPAFVIVSGTVTDPDGLDAYREKAGPLAQGAGLSILARSEVKLLEGEWPHTRQLTIEKFDSMLALDDFWYSEAYQQAKALRAGKFDTDFIIAVEGF